MTKKFEGEDLVVVEGVTKSYGNLHAVDNVSLKIKPGEIVALLGPNGAGKTTLIGCITGLVAGFEGSIKVAGYDVVDDYRITRRLIGLVPQELNYDAFFKVRQVIEFQGGYYGERPSKAKVDAILKSFSLLDKAEANTRWLSGGMKRRLMICKALMHDPALLFLDEPTAGVDVELREELWSYVRTMRDEGMTIVLTTHYIEEAEQLADRVGIINRGKLIRVDETQRLMEEFGKRHVDIQLKGPQADVLAAELELEVIAPDRVRLSYQQSDELNHLLRVIAEKDVEVSVVEGGRSSLESIFMELVHAHGNGQVERDDA
ncbi:MAG: ABC transporter ATP-binding protein [Bradymonadaceae bacterium]